MILIINTSSIKKYHLKGWYFFILDSYPHICYNPLMQNREDLIHENTELRARLELAERWMRREVASSISKIQKDRLTRRTRSHVQGVWKEEGIDIMTERIMTEFSGVLDHAPKYTLERLIDAEIYWHTLQQYPQMDALPVVIAYQKIIDAWIEERLIAPWRPSMRDAQHEMEYSKLDTDIANIIEKRYTLSIGRWYQILSCIRTGSGDDGYI